MAGLRPYSLANVLGAAEGIRGARTRNELMNRQMDPNSLQNQLLSEKLSALRNPGPDYQTVGPGTTLLRDGEEVFTAPFKTNSGDPLISAFIEAREGGHIGDDVKLMDFISSYKKPLVDMRTMGGDADGQTPKGIGSQTGAPPAITNPWDHIQDPKERDKAKIKFLSEGQKRGQEFTKLAKNSRAMVGNIKRFLHLNKTNYTGLGMVVPGAKTVRKGLDPEFGEMQAIVDLMTPQMRQGMPGAASDRDVAMFRGATVGTEQDPAANKNIGMGLILAHENIINRDKFHSAYVTANKHDLGFEDAWHAYLEENPIFDPTTPEGSYQLNTERKSWGEHFYPGSTKPNEKPLGIDEEYESLRRELYGE